LLPAIVVAVGILRMTDSVMIVLLGHHVLVVALTGLTVVPRHPVLDVTHSVVHGSVVALVRLHHLIVVQNHAVLHHLIVLLHYVAVLRDDLRIGTLHWHLARSWGHQLRVAPNRHGRRDHLVHVGRGRWYHLVHARRR
jgi:hypothetical protein